MSFLELAEKCWLLFMLVALAIMGARREVEAIYYGKDRQWSIDSHTDYVEGLRPRQAPDIPPFFPMRHLMRLGEAQTPGNRNQKVVTSSGGIEEGDWLERGMREFWVVTNIFYNLFWRVVTQMCLCRSNLQISSCLEKNPVLSSACELCTWVSP